MLKTVRNACFAAQQGLRMVFENNELRKQELKETTREWVKQRSLALENATIENLGELQQRIIGMQKNAKESANISSREQGDLLTILRIKENMSLTNSQENDKTDQFMRSLNRIDRIRLDVVLPQALSKQRCSRRSVHKRNELFFNQEESDKLLNQCEPYFTCKLNCGRAKECNVVQLNLSNLMEDEFIEMKNRMNGEYRIAPVRLI
uniref:Uncharacterized protein n=1 Tax=Elaeophora elaphi TaxID=1147741 RepID=A0A0R3RM62_9BILA